MQYYDDEYTNTLQSITQVIRALQEESTELPEESTDTQNYKKMYNVILEAVLQSIGALHIMQQDVAILSEEDRYKLLFKVVTQIIRILQQSQEKAEEIYISGEKKEYMIF